MIASTHQEYLTQTSMFILIIKARLYSRMHVHVNAWLTSLTLRHHITYGVNEWTYECVFITSKQKKQTLI